MTQRAAVIYLMLKSNTEAIRSPRWPLTGPFGNAFVVNHYSMSFCPNSSDKKAVKQNAIPLLQV